MSSFLSHVRHFLRKSIAPDVPSAAPAPAAAPAGLPPLAKAFPPPFGEVAEGVFMSDFPRGGGDNSFLSHSYGEFDEWGYLLFNPDVAEMVRNGKIASGQEHYRNWGEEEIRTGRRYPMPDYREMSYMLRNPDVFFAVRRGEIPSGRSHWESYGKDNEAAGARKPYISLQPKYQWTAETRRTWSEEGFLHIKGFFSSAEVDAVNECVDRLWTNRRKDMRPIDCDYFLDTPPCTTNALRDVPDEARPRPHKVNNLYYWEETVRRMLLDERLAMVLRTLLDGDPCVLTSLNFERGSEQGLHIDTLYMPPVIPYRMVATWIALEDIEPESGPLRYVPGSHRIPPFVFSTGRMRWNIPENDQFTVYMINQVAKRGLPTKEFEPAKGDLFIWHPLLFHGGSKILNPAKTRKSLVAHFFSAADYPLGTCDQANNIIMYGPGTYYENRIILSMPAEKRQLSWPQH
jgi:hypothetical protein